MENYINVWAEVPAMRLLRVLTVLVLVAVVTAPMTAATGVQSGQTQQEANPADEIYVQENGDAVLVYEGETEDDTNGTVEGDLLTSEGLAFGVLDSSEGLDSGSFDLSATLTGSGLDGSTSFQFERPDTLQAFDLTLETVRNADTSETSLEFSVEATPESSVTAFVSSASTSGSLEQSAESVALTGQASAETLAVTDSQTQSFSLSETDSGYQIDVSRAYTVGEFQTRQWESRERAQQTLSAQFGFISTQLGGTADVSIDSYSFDASTSRLDIEYQVTLQDVEAGLQQQLARSLAQDESVDLSQEEASEFAQRILSAEIDTVEATVEQEPGTATVNWNIELSNIADAQIAVLELSAASGEGINQSVIDRRQETLEASQAAGLQQTTEWSLDYTAEGGSVAVEGSVDASASNWAAFTDELESRDRTVGSQELDLSVTTEGEQVTGEGTFAFEREDLIQSAIDSGIDAAETDGDEEAVTGLLAFDEADFQQAKLEASADADGTTVRAGAQFGDLENLATLVGETYGGLDIGDVVVRTEDGTTRTYVYVEGAVSEGASEDDVRSLSVVDGETQVNMPGDYDREFPTADADRAANFLGVSLGDGDNGDGSDDGGGLAQPGMGVVVALVAIVISVVALRRRQ